MLVPSEKAYWSNNTNFMAHSAIWDYLPIQEQNKTSKKLTEEKLCENGFSMYRTFVRAHLYD